MLSSKEIIVPNNLLNVAHKKKGVKAGINKAIDDNRKDPTSFNQGLKEGYSKANEKPEAINDNNASGNNSLKPTKGGFQGGGTNSSAFK